MVEIERRGVRAALARSFRLVRGHFWLVLAVLVPIEIAGDAAHRPRHRPRPHACSATRSSPSGSPTPLSNIVLTPFYAVAAVLLTLDLIAAKDGRGPRLHSAPARR